MPMNERSIEVIGETPLSGLGIFGDGDYIEGIEMFLYGLFIVVTSAHTIFKKSPDKVFRDRMRNSDFTSRRPSYTYDSSTEIKPRNFSDSSEVSQETKDTNVSTDFADEIQAKFKDKQSTSNQDQDTTFTKQDYASHKDIFKPKKRGFLDFMRYWKKPYSFKLEGGEILAIDEDGEPLEIAKYSAEIQEELALETYLAHGAENTAAFIHALPIVKSGQVSADIVTVNIFGKILDALLADSYLTEEEELELDRLCKLTGGFNAKAAREEDMNKLVKAHLVRDLLLGNVKPLLKGTVTPAILEKDEILIWEDLNISFTTTKTEQQFTGASTGMSIKIAKGVYYRLDSNRGFGKNREVIDKLGPGYLIVTNKNIYVGAFKRNFKVPLAKLLSVTPFDNEVKIFFEGNDGRPIYAEVDDPQFWANIIANASNWA